MSSTITSFNFFRSNPTSYWLPRLLGVLGILMFSILSVDVFEEDYKWWEIIIAFLIHMIPTFIFAIALFIGWSNELYGSIIFNILGLFTMFFFGTLEDIELRVKIFRFIIISFPFFLIAELFLYHWYRTKPKPTET